MDATTTQLAPVTHAPWQAENAIAHGFFTREGGVSSGLYSGLNTGIGSQDDRQNVDENRARIASYLGVPNSSLNTVHQVHSADVIVIDEPIDIEMRPKADAMVTRQRDLALGVLTADCAPVLFADTNAGVIGAAHAGWKGALDGVVGQTVVAMEGLGAKRSDIKAVLGPCISQDNYEVGEEFRTRFLAANPDNQRYFEPSRNLGHHQFDLPRFIIDQMIATGIQAEPSNLCTYADEDRFFSYRRTTHRGEQDYGRQMSAIALTS